MGRIESFSGNQSGAEGSHDAGDVRANHVAAGDFLQCTQYGVVIKCAALHDDVPAKLRGGGDLHHLEQSILDDGVGKACRDVGYAGAFLLGLLDAGVHENGAAGAKVDGILGKKRRLCKVHYRIIQRFCKGLDKGAATGGTGLVQGNGIYGTVPNADAFHILSADVENAVHLRVKIRSTVVVRNGFDLAPVQPECGLHQRFAVAG